MAKAPVCGVYRITSPSVRFYVGSSVNVASRWSGHRAELRKGRHHCPPLQRAAEKYGVDALRFELLAECPRDDVRELEQLVLDVANPAYNASRSTVEALTGLWQQPEFRRKGQDRMREQAKEWRKDPEWVEKQRAGAKTSVRKALLDPAYRAAQVARATARLESIVNTPEVKAKAAQARRDRYASDPEAARKRSDLARSLMLKLHADQALKDRLREEARARMKAARADPEAREKNLKGVRAAHCKPVRCVETGQEFPSIEEAAKWCGLAGGGKISMALNGKREHAGGYHWARVEKAQEQA